MEKSHKDATVVRRERLWNWGFWASLVVFEALGVALSHMA